MRVEENVGRERREEEWNGKSDFVLSLFLSL
jgi:hypothetical protein